MKIKVQDILDNYSVLLVPNDLENGEVGLVRFDEFIRAIRATKFEEEKPLKRLVKGNLASEYEIAEKVNEIIERLNESFYVK